MNFKIENNYININNYPYGGEHFEKMARKGWLISKIFGGSLFIYRKIRPEELDFSISPFEVETFFTKKTKEELEEFHTVCQYVGWNYATSTGDLHIYYKEKGLEATPLETDEEETFKTLEKLAKKEEVSSYFASVIGLILSWFLISSFFKNISAMKDGLMQLLLLSIPILLPLTIYRIIVLNKFLTRNRKRMERGEAIVFDNSDHLINRVLMSLFTILFIIGTIFIIYSSLTLNNSTNIIGFLPSIIGFSIGMLFRIIVKPSRKNRGIKFIFIIILFIVGIQITTALMMNSGDRFEKRNSRLGLEDYRILSIDDFLGQGSQEDMFFRENISLLVPRSYDYSSYSHGQGFVATDYSKALNEAIAKNLVGKYIKASKRRHENSVKSYVYESLDLETYQAGLSLYGITEDDFKDLKDQPSYLATKEAQKLAADRAVKKVDHIPWQVDEIYYLSFEKDQLLIRDGREVFYLKGQAFSDENILAIVKERLQLK